MQTKLQRWGKSLTIRVPKGIVAQAGIAVDDTLDIEIADNGAIVLKPRRRRKYRLNDLLKDMTKENMHKGIGYGPPTGREVW